MFCIHKIGNIKGNHMLLMFALFLVTVNYEERKKLSDAVATDCKEKRIRPYMLKYAVISIIFKPKNLK